MANIKIPFLSDLPVLNTILSRHKIRINAINHFLLAGDKFIPEMLLIQPGFTYNACGPFTKKNFKMKKFKETWDWRYIYQNEIDKPCFQVCFLTDEDFNDLNRRTAAVKELRDKAFDFVKNPKYGGY